MAYDHGKKAGNRGDVWKHAVLVSIADRIPPTTDFEYLETHSGGPVHSLSAGGEWICGVRQALDRPGPANAYLSLAEAYLETDKYPAGWVFFATRLCTRIGRLIVHLRDLDDGVAERYAERLDALHPGNAEVRFAKSDGFRSWGEKLIPDLVFLDPPYSPNAKADWKALADACLELKERKIPFVAWYPFYWPTQPQRLVNRTMQTSWEVHWTKCGSKQSQNLKGCGMLVSETIRPLLHSARLELEHVAARLDSELVHRVPTTG